MKIYSIRQTQFIPISLAEAWDFFSSPHNLARITPAKMKFVILSVSGGNRVYAGQIIRYTVRVLPFYTVHWMTEITHVQEPNFFADEQRFGPYALWHHQHFFKEVEGGIEMTDEVHYAIPLGILGRLAHTLFVGRELTAIFEYRFQAVAKYFSAKHSTHTTKH
jgi:ligand-binding SRPBCC domain-containing protein